MAYDKLVLLDDQGRIFTAKAGGTISGGDVVEWLSGTDCVGSDANTYAWDDIAVRTCQNSGGNTLGVAVTTATSGTGVAVLAQGFVMLPAGSRAITGGTPVTACGYGNMVESVSWSGNISGCAFQVGTAWTAATADEFAIIRLNV